MRRWRGASRGASWGVEADFAHARLEGGFGRRRQGDDLDSSARARAGWHEQRMLFVWSSNSNPLGLIRATPHGRLLRPG